MLNNNLCTNSEKVISSVEAQIKIALLNGILSLPKVSHYDLESDLFFDALVTCDDAWVQVDKNTAAAWSSVSMTDNSPTNKNAEARFKFALKELADNGIIDQIENSLFSVNKSSLEKYRDQILGDWINSDLMLEGVNQDGTLTDCFSASNESSDKPVFLSAKDFQTALTAYVKHGYRI